LLRKLKRIPWRKKLHNTQTMFGNSKSITQICTPPKKITYVSGKKFYSEFMRFSR
jgi:hypothetical protein